MEITVTIDRRNNIQVSMLELLRSLGMIKEQPKTKQKKEVVAKANQKEEIAKAVTERFIKNRKRKGELTETEIALLNSQINASYHFSKI